MNNLWAFGCSETFGLWLPDTCQIDDDGICLNPPSKYAWPQILSDKLNLNCINKGVGGNSNKGILQNLLENINEISKNDIVFIQWSHIIRTNVYTNSGKNMIINSFAVDADGKRMLELDKEKDEIMKAYESYVVSIDYIKTFVEDLYIYMDYLNLKLDCNIYHFIVGHIFNLENKTPKWTTAKILSTNSIRESYPKAIDDIHTGIQGHAAIAEKYYKHIIKEIE